MPPACSKQMMAKGACPLRTSYGSAQPGALRALVLTFAIIVILVAVATFAMRYYGNPMDLLRKRVQQNRIYEVSRRPLHLPDPLPPRQTLSLQELQDIRHRFEKGAFQNLTRQLEALQSGYEENHRDEYKINDALHVFEATLENYRDLLDEWVAETPGRFPALLARAQYLEAMGWKSRGFKWARNTSADQMKQMREYFKLAIQDFAKALQINPNLFQAYRILIAIHNAQGDEAAQLKYMASARERFGDSFLVQSTCMWAMEPRWGGSYPEMEQIATQAQVYFQTNPELYVLYGIIYADQGWYAREAKQYPKAIGLYTRALEYGAYAGFYKERARIYLYNLKDYGKALDDINRAIELYPTLESTYLYRSRILYRMNDMNGALRDLALARQLLPGDAETEQSATWAAKDLMRQGHKRFKQSFRQAITQYDMALQFDPTLAQAHYWRGVAESKLSQYAVALQDCRAAVELDPDYFEAYRMIDDLLARDNRWDDIVAYWNTFLRANPQHAEAFLERAGTYHHQGNQPKALADLKKACDLGLKKACELYTREKSR